MKLFVSNYLKLFSFCLLLLLFVGCDEKVTYNYYVTNNCDSLINIEFEDNKATSNKIDLNSGITKKIYKSNGLNKLYDDKIEIVFVNFLVIKGKDTSCHNFLDNKKWIFTIQSEARADYELLMNEDVFTNI